MNANPITRMAQLITELGGVTGRTRLQKMVHLLGVVCPEDFYYRYTLHYFGPFSRELAGDLDFLVNADRIKETPGSGSESPFRYEPNPKLIKNGTGGCSPPDEPKWLALARRLNLENKAALEATSTLVFLARCKRCDWDACRVDFVRIKPHLAAEFNRAKSLADEIGISLASS